jgi:hypothetical protein
VSASRHRRIAAQLISTFISSDPQQALQAEIAVEAAGLLVRRSQTGAAALNPGNARRPKAFEAVLVAR